MKNSFAVNEWSGAVADLGTLLPLTFGLVVFNEFPLGRLLLLWGIIYVITGWLYKVPISVQPLKAVAVLALSHGFSIEFISSTAVFYGILLLFLVSTKLISRIETWFTPAVTVGIQVGIGLILAQKAVSLVIERGGFLHTNLEMAVWLKILTLIFVLLMLVVLRSTPKIPGVLLIVIASILIFQYIGIDRGIAGSNHLISVKYPQLHFLSQSFVLLILPQLPLTLGNAVFAASRTSHELWGEQAQRVTPERLAATIGTGNVFIGFLGGFPMCHGAGGMAAHAQFGGKTGGTTIILGISLLMLALIPGVTSLVFLIPVPLLAGLLIFDSWRMIAFSKNAENHLDLLVISVVAVLSLLTRNLLIALIAGKSLEYLLPYLLGLKNQIVKEIDHD